MSISIKTILLSIALVLAINTKLFSQDTIPRSNTFITGTVFAEKTGKPIPFANVERTRVRKGTITDTLGFFHTSYTNGDLLKVSCLGYMTEYIKLTDSMLVQAKFNLEVKLKQRYYLLREVDIFELRWDEFEQKVKELKLPEDMAKKQAKKWLKEALSEEFLSGLGSENPGIKIPITSRYDKRRMAALKMEKQLSERRKAIKKMYYLSARYTHLQGETLDYFINYCNYSTDFLNNNNDYDITMRIKRDYFNFTKQHSRQ